MKKSDYTILPGSGIVRKRRTKTNGYAVEIGGMNASLDTEMLKNKGLQKFLVAVGERLCKQLKCDAVIFNDLTFQRMWKPKTKKPTI